MIGHICPQLTLLETLSNTVINTFMQNKANFVCNVTDCGLVRPTFGVICAHTLCTTMKGSKNWLIFLPLVLGCYY